MSRRYTKIKLIKEGGVYLEFQQKAAKEGAGYDDYTVNTKEMPAGKFVDCFHELAPFFVELCELPEEDLNKERIDVRSVSFSYGGEKEVMGATLSGMRKLFRSVSPLNLNTPHKPSEPYQEAAGGDGSNQLDENSLLDPELVDLLKKLCKRADEFLAGHRAQTNLFVPENSTPAAASAASPFKK